MESSKSIVDYLLLSEVPKNSIAWLLLSSVLTALVAYTIYLLVTRKQISEKIEKEVAAEYKTNLEKLRAEAKMSEETRIRSEIIRWANPLGAAINNLYYRLDNILCNNAYFALNERNISLINPNWSINYEYFFNSTIYLFSQYFAWTRILEEEINIEFFHSPRERDKLYNAIEKVRSCLSSYPLKTSCKGKDYQVFALQQRAIAELLIIKENDTRRCMGYPEFLMKIGDEESFKYHLKPLKDFIENISPDEDCRWKRLIMATEALSELRMTMEELGILYIKRD